MKSFNQSLMKTVLIVLLFITGVCYGQVNLMSMSGISNPKAASVEFIKREGGMLVFAVSLAELPVRGCTIKISDETGEIIFENRITAETYNQTYRIERNDLNKINFEITGKKYRFRESFQLRFIIEEKVEVTKI